MPDTFNYTPEDLINPLGSRQLSARAKFYQRSLYKDAIYPDNVATPLDTWYDKNLFGRVDQNQNAIIVKEARLVTIRKGVTEGMYALDFVEQAFMDFADHMQRAYITNCISRGGNPLLFNIKAHAAYISPTLMYNKYMTSLSDSFNANYVDIASKPIKKFADYKKVFIEYLKLMCEGTPITRTNFLLSNFVSSFISGLKIAIDDGDADSDSEKFTNFINDPNYSYYVDSAKKFGFIVDKNIPWVLTADLFSDVTLDYLEYYMNERNELINKDNFFETYFYKGYWKDIELLSWMMSAGYAQFVSSRPFYAEEKIIFNRRCPESALKTKTFNRTPASTGDTLTAKESVDLYTWLRHKEAQGNGPTLKTLRRKSYEILRTYGRYATSLRVPQYINDSYKDFLYPPHYGQANRDLKLDKDTSSGIIDTALEMAKSIATPY